MNLCVSTSMPQLSGYVVCTISESVCLRWIITERNVEEIRRWKFHHEEGTDWNAGGSVLKTTKVWLIHFTSLIAWLDFSEWSHCIHLVLSVCTLIGYTFIVFSFGAFAEYIYLQYIHILVYTLAVYTFQCVHSLCTPSICMPFDVYTQRVQCTLRG